MKAVRAGVRFEKILPLNYFCSPRTLIDIEEKQGVLASTLQPKAITMANKAPYQTTFEPEHTIQPIYTGGSVALDQSGRILATTLGEDALLTDLNTGKQLAKIEGVCMTALSISTIAYFCAGWRTYLDLDLLECPTPPSNPADYFQ